MIDPDVSAEGLLRIANRPGMLTREILAEIASHPAVYPELSEWASRALAENRLTGPPPPLPGRAGRTASGPRPVRSRRAPRSARRAARTVRRRPSADGAAGRRRLWAFGCLAVLLALAAGVWLGYGLAAPPRPGAASGAQGQALGEEVLRAWGEGFGCSAEGRLVECVGLNAHGEIGLPLDQASGRNRFELPGEATAIVAGKSHACASTADAVLCWGDSRWQQTARGPGADPAPAPVAELDGRAITGLWAGEIHSCAASGGEVWCWGGNNTGQLGTGSAGEAAGPAPVRLDGAAEVRGLFGTRFATCAIVSAREQPLCWGSNIGGFIASGDPSEVLGPTPQG